MIWEHRDATLVSPGDAQLLLSLYVFSKETMHMPTCTFAEVRRASVGDVVDTVDHVRYSQNFGQFHDAVWSAP